MVMSMRCRLLAANLICSLGFICRVYVIFGGMVNGLLCDVSQVV